MKDLQNRIQQMLNEKKTHSRAVALITALSLLMMFIVPYAGAVPGAAMTGTGANDVTGSSGTSVLVRSGEGTVPIDSAGWIDGEWTAITGLNINSYVNKLYLSTTQPSENNKGTEYTTTPITFPVEGDKSTSLYISMDYSLPREVLQTNGFLIDPATGQTPEHFLQFQLNDADFQIANSQWGNNRTVMDGNYTASDGSHTAGYYSLSKDTGLLTVRLTDEYLAYLRSQNSGCLGSLMIGGTVMKGEGEDANRTVTVGGFDVVVDFPDRVPEMRKYVVGSTADSITWEIKINNPDGVLDMSAVSVIDVLKTTDGDPVEWNSTNIEIDTSVSTSGITLTETGFGIPESAKNNTEITIRYTQKNAQQNVEYSNAAKIHRDGKTDVEQEYPSTHTITNKLSISKSGTPDYVNGTPNNEIFWTVRVSNDFGYPLKCVVVDDTEFDFTSANILEIKDDSGNVIGSDKYTITGGDIVFNNDVTFTNATISFKTAVNPTEAASENGYQITNHVEATSQDPENTPAPSGVVPAEPVTYKHQFSVVKYVGNGSSNSQKKVQWKVEVKADYGGNSQASLDGCVIKDAAFIGKTLNKQNVSGFITYNAWSRNGNVNAKDYLRFDGPDAQGNVTIHVTDNEPVYEINFFVDQAYADATYTSGSYNSYQAGGEVTMQNYAEGGNTTLGVSDSDTVDYTTKMADEVSAKNYTGADSSLYVMGNPAGEETTKELPWEVIAKREGGIDTTVTVTDVLLETVTGSHYITPEQAAQSGWLSVVKSNSSSFETFEAVNSSDYEVLFYETADSTEAIANFTEQTAKNAVKIEVKFKSSLNAIYAKLSYSSTADLSKVTPGTTAQFNNKAKTKDNYKEQSGLTFTREDPGRVKNFYLHVLKKWSDAYNALGKRPSTLTFTVQRTTDDPDDANAQWQTVGTAYTANMNASYGSEEVWLKDASNQDLRLPQWDDQGNRYYYKVLETMPENSDYVIKSQDAPFLAQFEDNATKTYSITNAPESALKKYAINDAGETVTALEYSNIPRVTIDNTEYYLFRWKVEMVIPSHSPAVSFTETLPENALFINDSISEQKMSSQYMPNIKYSWGEQRWYNDKVNSQQDGTSLTITVRENLSDDVAYLTYYIGIPVSSYPNLADGGTVISNTISDADNNISTASLTVQKDAEPEPTEPEGSSAVTKQYVLADQRGSITYRLDVNPNEDNISAGDTIQITDKLDMASSDPSLSGVEVSLANIQVHRYVTGESSDPVINSFDYLQKSKGREDKEYTLTQTTADYNGTKNIWMLSGWDAGDQITLDVTTGNGQNPNCQLVFSANKSGINPYEQNSHNIQSTSAAYDVPSGTERVYLLDWNSSQENAISSVNVSGKSKEYPSLLTVEVPDEEHVWVEYTYNVTGYPNYTVERHETDGGTVQYWKITGFQAGDSIAAVIHRVNGVSETSGDVKYWIANYAPNITDYVNNYDNWRSFTDDATYDNDRITVQAAGQDNQLYIADLGKLKNGSSFALEDVLAAPSVRFTNSASYKEANGSGSAVSENNEMQVSYSSMSISVTRYPEIYKTDIGSDNINTLAAQFKIAKYVQGTGWVYASSIEVVTSGNKKARKPIFPADATGYTEPDHAAASGEKTYPEGAVTLAFDDTDTTNGIHNFILNEREVYKFVEIVAPDGYLQPDWTNGGFATNQDFIFCYAYGGAVKSDYPQEVQDHLKTWTKESKLNIPNSSRITVSAKKTFSGAHPPEHSDVTLALYYATNANGKNKTLVDETLLDLSASEKEAYQTLNGQAFSFTNPIVLHYDLSNANQPVNTVGWEQLPSGKDGDTLYYYVVEESYTITEGSVTKTYRLDETDGKYYEYNTSTNSFVENAGSKVPGKYRPISDGKGTKTNGAVIEINNSEGILIKKTWRDTNKNAANPPQEAGSPEGKMQIPVKVTGRLQGVTVELDLGSNNLLSADDDYQMILPDPVTIVEPADDEAKGKIGYVAGKTYYLKDFSSFTVEEVLDSTKSATLTSAGYLLDQTKISGSASDGFGEFEIINTKQADETTVDASVEKVWVGTPKDRVSVKLIQTTTALSNTDLKNVDASQYTSINSGKDVVVVTSSGTSSYTFASDITNVSVEPSGIVTATADSSDSKKINITGGATEGAGTITVTFAEGSQTIHVAVVNQTATLTTGYLSKTWNGLPKYAADGTTEYHYYVVETDNLIGYTVSYSVNGQMTTITNAQQTVNLKIQKVWAGDDNQDHSGETIQFVVRRTTDATKAGQSGQGAAVQTESIEVAGKIFAVSASSSVYQGDSMSLSATLNGEDVTSNTIFTYKIGDAVQVNTNTAGEYTITATYTNAGKTYTKDITVTVLNRGLQLNNGDASVDVSVGSTVQLTPSYANGSGTPSISSYTSSNTSVASVDENGIVTGVDAGTVTITATDSYGNTDTITVNISESTPSDEFTLSGLDSVNVGQQIVITPSDARGGITYTYTDTIVPDPLPENYYHASFDASTGDDGTWTGLLKNQGTYRENKTVTLTATRGSCTQTKIISVGIQGRDVNDTLSSGDTLVVSLTGTPNTNVSCQFGLQNSSWGTIGTSDQTVSFDATGNGTATISIDNSNTGIAHVQIWNAGGIVNLQNVTVEAGTTPSTPSFSITPTAQTITEGGYVDFTPSMQNGTLGTVTYTVSPNTATVSGNRITFNYSGTYTVTASTTYNEVEYTDTATITVTASGGAFTVSPTSINTSRGATFTITASSNFDNVSTPGWGQEIIGNTVRITVPDWAGDTATITLWRGGQSATVNVTVTSAASGQSLTGGQTMQAMSVASSYSSRPLRIGNMTKTVGADASDSEVTSLFFNTSASDIIQMGSGLTPSIGLKRSTFSGGSISIQSAGSAADPWTKEITGLPAVDENGNKYYYWVEEIPVTGYAASYTNNRIDAVELAGQTPQITITNTKTEDSTPLPESGSTGTRIYYTLGAMLLLLAAAGYATYSIKRRRWYDE